MANSTPKFQAVIFDMDGVLVDTSPCHTQAYDALWQCHEIDEPSYSEIAGRSTINVLSEYLPNLSAEQLNEAVQYKQQQALLLIEKADIVFNDTQNVLQKLVQQNTRLFLATSASRASTELVLERLHATSVFEKVTTSEDVLAAKPAPDLFLAAIEHSQQAAVQCLVIEDSIAGVQAAIAAGAYVASVRSNEMPTDSELYLGHFADLESLYQYLLNMNYL